MVEYIEREALKAVFEEDGHLSAYVEEMIDSIPAADVRPVVRGKWKEDWETGCSECSACGESYLWEDYDGVGEWNFCPNCGATMETRARWIPNVPPRDLRPRCSVCGELNPTKESTCPNCGADMGEES